MPDPSAIQEMFTRVAPRYDRANRVLSLGFDHGWRKQLVRAVARHDPRDVLDLATGSGDVAFALTGNLPVEARVVGMDFCQPMLDQAEARREASADPRLRGIRFMIGDGLAIPLPDSSQDALTIAFGIRNMADRPTAMAEFRRVLRPNGWLHILEFSQPWRGFAPLYYAYLRWIAPRIAGWITGVPSAYDYLGYSIRDFPDHVAMQRELSDAGFDSVRILRMTMGIVALHSARKPGAQVAP
jgi:demethylmenaquinone methyltransferase/2-methoxy-6-polyprenyl-1,4-benzoquinol methylase